MTYSDDIKALGKQWVWYIEIEPRTCAEVYGVSPCIASGGQCAYSWATCEDKDNFNLTTKTFRFQSKEAPQIDAFPPDIVYPTLESVSDIPTEIDPKKSITLNARVTMTFQDVKNPPPFDVGKGAGKFHDYRSNGTFWRIFTRIYRESYKYCSVKIYEGLTSYTSKSSFSLRRELKLNDIQFQNNGKVKVTATDKTRLSKVVKIPNAISSSNVTTAQVTAGDSFVPVTDPDEFKILNSGYASYGKIIDSTAGDEYFKFTEKNSIGDLAGVTRGLFGTSDVTHASGCKVIQVAVFADDADTGISADVGENPVDICKQIILGWTDIVSGDVDTTDFDDERDNWYESLKYRRIIESPITADKLLSQLNQFMMSNIWQDENQKLTFKGIVPVNPGEDYTEIKTAVDVLEDTVQIDSKTETQVSRVIVHFAPDDIWGKKDHSDEDDFSEHLIWINAEAENPNGQGDPVEIEFFADWIYNLSEAKSFASRYIRRFAPYAPSEISFHLYRKDTEIYTGDIIDFTSGFFVDDDGTDDTINVQILSKSESQRGVIKLKTLQTKFSLKYAFICPTGYPDWTSATTAQKKYAYICEEDSLGNVEMSDGSEPSYIW